VAFFLGIDGGGSKTSCLIGDENSALGSGTAAGSNVVRVGEAQARDALTAAISQACVAARITPAQLTRTCIGVAGAARPQISEAVRRLLSELIPGQIDIYGDMVIAFEAAFGAGPGVIVIAGTGSIAYGRTAAGQTARAGGWGFAISDEGSGHWIGRAAVAAVMRAYDEDEGEAQTEAESSPLLAGIMKVWGVRTREQLVLAANGSPSRDFAGLFPAVLAAAGSGDALASAILTRAAAELATLAEIVISRLFPDAATVPVAMSGGVFGNSALLRQIFYNSLRSHCPNAAVRSTVFESVEGALALARKGPRS
jgi:N-acetylglucosamine kinase-like BadF-type ATPase